MFTSANESNIPMRALLRHEGWTPSGVLTGLDEGDPEHVFFRDAPARSAQSPAPRPRHRNPQKSARVVIASPNLARPAITALSMA